MLPGTLVSVYRQYKQDTDAVASWLASTAKACGYPKDLLSPVTNPTPSSGRLKGKARKEAKKAGNVSTAQPAAAKYIVALKDFVPLAEFIARSQEPLVSVPVSFSTTIDRVIALRSGFGAQMSELGSAPSAASEEEHQHFVGILQAVRQALKPRMSTSTAPSTNLDLSKDADESLATGFNALELYEPSQEYLDAPDIERPGKATGDDALYETEPLTSLEDAVAAYFMLMNDLSRIRSTIKWIWGNYRDRLFDVAAAAVATDTAIDLARGIIEDVSLVCKDHGGTLDMIKTFYVLCCLRKGYTESQILSVVSAGRPVFDKGTYDISTEAYIITAYSLKSFTQLLHPRKLPLVKEGMFGIYDPCSDRNGKSAEEKLREDKILLTEQLTELMTVIRMVPGYPVQDGFLRGMKEVDKTHEVPLYVAFAAQTFLDIHHILRDEVSRGFKELMQQTKVMDHDLESHLEFHKTLKVDTWNLQNDLVLREMQRKLKWIGSDPVWQEKTKQYNRDGNPVPESMKPHRILQRSPVLAGLMLYHFRAAMYDIGITIANAWGSITYSAHLYHALEREKLLERRWIDMDVTRTLIRASNFYPGDPPTNPEEYFTKFCIQMGVSAAAFTNPNRRRQRVTVASRAGPRGIKPGIPVSSVFEDRYLHNSERIAWTAKNIDYIVSQSEYEEEGSVEDGTFAMGQIDDPQALREKRARANRKKAVEGAAMSPNLLIRALVLALQAESLEFAFPYIFLHRWSWKLLRAVKETCDPLLRQIYTPAYMERENELPFVVGYILMANSGIDGREKDDRLMITAAHAVKEFIASGAGEFIVKLLAATHGLYIQPADKTNAGPD